MTTLVSMSSLIIYDASAVVHTCSSSRRLPDSLVASLFRSRFPPRLLTGMTLRPFGITACTANPEGLPPSLAQHGSCWRSSTSTSLPFQDTLTRVTRVRAASDYNFGKMAVASCSSAERDGGAPAGETAIRR